MEVHPRIFDPAKAKEYLQAAIQDEEQALAARRIAYPDLPDVLYYVDRDRVAKYVNSEIQAQLAVQHDKPLRVLLLGDGIGNGAKELIRLLQEVNGEDWDKKVEVHMTSLKRFPWDHDQLAAQGVRVHTGILAEQLTSYGLGQFDVIGSDSMLGWTDMNYSLTQIRDSLTTGGMWIGIEARGRGTGVPWDRSGSDLPGVIEHHLRRGQMVPANSYLDRITARDGGGRMADDIYLLKYKR